MTFADGPRPAGVVLSQQPGPGGTAIPNSAVNVIISTGNNMVPETRGAPLVDATTLMDRAGFTITVEIGSDPNAPLDAVIAQSVPAGTVLPVGSVITLTVNQGAAPEQPDPAAAPVQP